MIIMVSVVKYYVGGHKSFMNGYVYSSQNNREAILYRCSIISHTSTDATVQRINSFDRAKWNSLQKYY